MEVWNVLAIGTIYSATNDGYWVLWLWVAASSAWWSHGAEWKELYRGFIYKQVAVDRVLRTVVLILYDLKPTLQTVAQDLPNFNIDGRIAILDASAQESR